MTIASAPKGTIEGVQIVPLRRIPDERGTVYQMLKRTDPYFKAFGEIYFSSVYPGVVKGWHRHREMTLNYACIFGRIKLAIYDERDGSPTRGNLMEVFLGPDNYSLVIIPPGVWNGLNSVIQIWPFLTSSPSGGTYCNVPSPHMPVFSSIGLLSRIGFWMSA